MFTTKTSLGTASAMKRTSTAKSSALSTGRDPITATRVSNFGRTLATVLTVLTLGAGLAVPLATPASAGVFTAKVLSTSSIKYVNVRAQATTSSTVLRTIASGQNVGLNCYSRGTSVTGPYGASTLWYSIDGGGWVTDAYIWTGSSNPVTPACGTSGRTVGQTRTYNAAYSAGECTHLAYQKASERLGGRFPALSGDAKNWKASAQATGWTVVADAQPNAIVVFQQGVYGALGTGHVAWVTSTQQRSDGLYITITEKNWTGYGVISTRTIKDVSGMSYILIP